MDLVVSLGFFAALILVWRWLAARMRVSGRGWFLRHLAGSSAGIVAGIVVVFLAALVGIIEPTKNAPSNSVAQSIEQKSPEVAKNNVEARDAPVATTVETPPVVKPVIVEKNLGMPPEVYAKRINDLLQELGKPYRVNVSDITSGEVNDVLKGKLGKYAALVASVSKESGQILSVTVIGAGDGSPASGLEIMSMASIALAAATPDADYREVFKGIPKMMDGKASIYSNVKLSGKSMDQMGTWFFAEPI